jgi:hypothetical protein
MNSFWYTQYLVSFVAITVQQQLKTSMYIEKTSYGEDPNINTMTPWSRKVYFRNDNQLRSLDACGYVFTGATRTHKTADTQHRHTRR